MSSEALQIKIEELKNEGLEREYSIFINSDKVLSAVDKEILEEAKTFKIDGFRQGKVPIGLVKKQIGQKLLDKHINIAIDTAVKLLFEKYEIRPSAAPFVELTSFEPELGIKLAVKVDILPNVPPIDWEKVEVDTWEVAIGDEDLEKAYDDIVKNYPAFSKTADDYEAKIGDKLKLDFVGKINGEEFSGGKAKDLVILLGSGEFIEGFEEQLIGVKAGDYREIKVKFPANYQEKTLASKEAVFEVDVKAVLCSSPVTIDNNFAEKAGFKNLEAFNEAIMDRMKKQFADACRHRTKKLLFDKLDSLYDFSIPPVMIKAEFDEMWKEAGKNLEQNTESEPVLKDGLKEEYERVAVRRVKLGIVFAEICRQNNIHVHEKDLYKAMYNIALQNPQQERAVIDFYSKPENLEMLKGPVLEDKTVDYILTKVRLNKILITAQEFNDIFSTEI